MYLLKSSNVKTLSSPIATQATTVSGTRNFANWNTLQPIVSREIKGNKNSDGSTVAFICTVCHQKFGTSMLLSRHIGRCQEKYQFECLKCESVFRLKDHLESHHGTHVNDFMCCVCSMYFATDIKYAKHLTKRHKDVALLSKPASIGLPHSEFL